MGIKQFLGDHKKEVLTAAGVFAAGALFYLAFGKKEQGKDKQSKKDSETTTVHIPKNESEIQVKFIEGTNVLTKESLMTIHSLIAKQMSAKYLKKTIESRKDRRKYLKSIQPYIKECKKLQEALDQIITQVTAKILLELKLDPDSYQNAYEYHVKNEGTDTFLDVIALPDPDSVPSQVQLTKQKVLEVYNYQYNVMEDVVTEVVSVTAHEASTHELDHLIEFRLLDLTSFNLGIEEEDLLNKYNLNFQSDPDVKIAIQKKDHLKRTYIIRFA